MEQKKTTETTVINLVRLSDTSAPNHNITHSGAQLGCKQRNVKVMKLLTITDLPCAEILFHTQPYVDCSKSDDTHRSVKFQTHKTISHRRQSMSS